MGLKEIGYLLNKNINNKKGVIVKVEYFIVGRNKRSALRRIDCHSDEGS